VKSGCIEIALIEVLAGETPHTDSLSEKGEGPQLLAFRVDDFDSTLAELATEGIESISRYSSLEGAFAYQNADRIGGVVFELFATSGGSSGQSRPLGRVSKKGCDRSLKQLGMKAELLAEDNRYFRFLPWLPEQGLVRTTY